jgi:hypothetical protein
MIDLVGVQDVLAERSEHSLSSLHEYRDSWGAPLVRGFVNSLTVSCSMSKKLSTRTLV